MGERGPTSVRSGWSREDPARPKQGGWACRDTVLGARLGCGGAQCRWAGPETGFLGGLEICRQPCESEKRLRGSIVWGVREDPFWVVVWFRGALLGGPGRSSGRPGKPVLELQVVLWFCGGSTEGSKALPGVQEGPASSALQVRGRVGLE